MRISLLLTVLVSASLQAQSLPYKNSQLPIAQRVNDLLGRMTLEEKFWQLYMIPFDSADSSADYSHGIFGLQVRSTESESGVTGNIIAINALQRRAMEETRLGIPLIFFEEGVHGVMAPEAVVYPSAIALAATWDTSLMTRVATAIATEARGRGIRHLLSPVINIATDVRWGRTEETYGEDPWLSALMGASYVRAVEGQGVITTPKHFVANVGEGGRDSYPIEISRHRLEEIHFPPFRAALAAGARSVMSSYNSVDGTPATQSRDLLTTTLRDRWHFTGFVLSDMAATGGATVLHMTEANTPEAAQHAFEAGLDVVFQSSWAQHRPYWEAFHRGLIADSLIDRAVRRVLTAKFELGLFDDPYVDSLFMVTRTNSISINLAREASARSLVLLRNQGILPLPAATLAVSVIGADAAEGRLGGYSATPSYPLTLLNALRIRFGRDGVRYAAGVPRIDSSMRAMTVPLQGAYFDNIELSGVPVISRADSAVDFAWIFSPPANGLALDWYSVRWTGDFTVPTGGVRHLGIEGNEGYRLYLDEKLLIDTWQRQSAGRRTAAVALRAGTRHTVRVEYRETVGNGRIRLLWDAGVIDLTGRQIAEAVAVARKSRVAIIAAGIEEGEFRDRSSLTLPGHQEDLIRAVARTGTPTIVILYGGSAVNVESWIDSVDAVIEAWYPGQQGGAAVVDALMGLINPAGRLPITFPQSEGQLPLVYNHKPTGRGDDYLDRSGAPRFPFGFGLSYTTFSYDSLSVSPSEIAIGDSAVVRVRVRNSGKRAGDEVVQLYLRDELASVAQPVRALKGMQRISLEPGESKTVTFVVGPNELQMLNREMRWVVEPGTFRVMIGASSSDIRQMATITVK